MFSTPIRGLGLKQVSNEQRRVLIPVVLEPNIQLIIRGIKLLSWNDALYILLHVVEVPLVTSPHANELDKLLKKAEEKLKPVADSLKTMGYKTEIKIVSARDVVEGITEELKLGNYTLVMLHKKRRKTVEKFMLTFTKSTSQRLIQKSNTPVMVIPVEEHV